MSARHFRLENALVRWYERWLVHGALVMCRRCQACQYAGEAGLLFRHAGRTQGDGQRPWHDLAGLLGDLPAASAVCPAGLKWANSA